MTGLTEKERLQLALHIVPLVELCEKHGLSLDFVRTYKNGADEPARYEVMVAHEDFGEDYAGPAEAAEAGLRIAHAVLRDEG